MHFTGLYDFKMDRSDEESSKNNSEDRCLSDPSYQAVISSLSVVSLVLGQPMSVRLLWLTLSSKHLDVLNCNLALFHLLQYCFFCAQLFFIFLSPYVQAKFYKFIFVYIQVGDPLQLCFICLERFIAVIHPTYFPSLKKFRFREACVAVVWMLTSTLAILFMFNESAQSLEYVAHWLPICLMAFLSGIMVFTSVKVAKALRSPTAGKESIHPAKRRAFITICVTSAVAMSCYIPVMVMEKYKEEDERKYKCRMVPVCIFFLSMASLVHPLFYLYAKGEFSCKRWNRAPG